MSAGEFGLISIVGPRDDDVVELEEDSAATVAAAAEAFLEVSAEQPTPNKSETDSRQTVRQNLENTARINCAPKLRLGLINFRWAWVPTRKGHAIGSIACPFLIREENSFDQFAASKRGAQRMSNILSVPRVNQSYRSPSRTCERTIGLP